MGDRLELHTVLTTLLNSSAAYFQPPESVNLVYPCIVYRRSNIRVDHADNKPYSLKKEYTLTVITKDPDSVLPEQVMMLESARHERAFVVDGLNHTNITIFY